MERAERECTEDADERAAARARGAAQRREQDRELIAAAIGKHTAVRGSGRAGRTAAGKNLDEPVLAAAVAAAVRHKHTAYDEMLAAGSERSFALFQAAHGTAEAGAANCNSFFVMGPKHP